MFEVTGISLIGKHKLGRFTTPATVKVLARASFDSGKGLPPCHMFHIDGPGVVGTFTAKEAQDIVSKMVA